MILACDGKDYSVLINACTYVYKNCDEGICIEIGTRKGGSAKLIVDSLLSKFPLICVDPYGNLDYYYDDKYPLEKRDYTNSMRDIYIPELIKYASAKNTNLVYLCIDDSSYYESFKSGFPIFDNIKKVHDKYALVYYDGQHTTRHVDDMVSFFKNRMCKNGIIVIDDMRSIDSEYIVKRLMFAGFSIHEESRDKWSFVKL